MLFAEYALCKGHTRVLNPIAGLYCKPAFFEEGAV